MWPKGKTCTPAFGGSFFFIKIIWRIMVSDANLVGETDIKIRFNKLCEQFERNENDLAIKDMYEISESEDISYDQQNYKKQ